MFIQKQSGSHQLCWRGPIRIRLPNSVTAEITNPLIALDILQNHWQEQDKNTQYYQALETCMKAIQGKTDLADAKEAFKRATLHLSI